MSVRPSPASESTSACMSPSADEARLAQVYVSRAIAKCLSNPGSPESLGYTANIGVPAGRLPPSATRRKPRGLASVESNENFETFEVPQLQHSMGMAKPGMARNASVASFGAPPGIGPMLEDLSRCQSLAASRAQSVVLGGVTCLTTNGLSIGSHRDVCDVLSIKRLGIRAFLCVAAEVVDPLPMFVTDDDVGRDAVSFLHLKMVDSDRTTLLDHAKDVFDFIDSNIARRRPVALYCQQGKSRSASYCVMYLMREHNIDAHEALELLQSVYPRAEPNFFFLTQLTEITPSDLPPKPQSQAAPSDDADPDTVPDSPLDVGKKTAQPTPDDGPLQMPASGPAILEHSDNLPSYLCDGQELEMPWVIEAGDELASPGPGSPNLGGRSGIDSLATPGSPASRSNAAARAARAAQHTSVFDEE